MGFLRRQCWHCAAEENAHAIVAATRKSQSEYHAFLVCPNCQSPSYALLQSSILSETSNDAIVEYQGDIRNSLWKVVRLWPEVGGPGHAEQQLNLSDPAERTYKRALDIAKRTQSNTYHDVALSGALSPVQESTTLKRRVTLREFSESLILSQPKRDH